MNQQDCLRRFLFEDHNVRGEWVRLQHSWQQAKQHQALANGAVESRLGQALAAVALLSATIKFKGAMILQIQGSGDLKTLVAQASSERTVRCLARGNPEVAGGSLKQMLGGGGRLVLTVESDISEPSQGIVGVTEEELADVLRTYFTQSEQLDTRLWLFANETQAAGLFIQELPSDRKDKADWERIEMLASTVTEREMFELDCEDMLHRLFHEEKVRVYDPEPIEFKCNCSRTKIGGTLLALGKDELHAILRERDDIEVDCQFCGAQYRFDRIDVESLLANSASVRNDQPPTRH